MSDTSVSSRRRRRLSPSEKYEIWVSVLTGQATQREAAERSGWTGRRWCTAAGSRSRARWTRWRQRCRAGLGRVAEAAALAEARRGDRAAAGHGHRAGGGAASARGKSALGLSAGPVPPRVDAMRQGRPARAGRPRRAAGLVDHGGPACCWGSTRPGRRGGGPRRAVGRLADRRRGGGAVHGLLDGAGRDPGAVRGLGRDRPLPPQAGRTAAPGSELVHVSASPPCGGCWPPKALCCKAIRPREPAVRAPWPEWVAWKPNRDLVLRLHPLHPRPPGRGRGHGRGVAPVAGHAWSRPRRPPPRSRSPSPPRSTRSSLADRSTPALLARAARRQPPRRRSTAPTPRQCRCCSR